MLLTDTPPERYDEVSWLETMVTSFLLQLTIPFWRLACEHHFLALVDLVFVPFRTQEQTKWIEFSLSVEFIQIDS